MGKGERRGGVEGDRGEMGKKKVKERKIGKRVSVEGSEKRRG